MEVVEVSALTERNRGWLLALLPAVVIVWGFVAIYLLQLAIDSTGKGRVERMMQELAYFPSGVALREMALEYRELIADGIWLTAIDYYGRHQETDRRYEWLGHIFEILTTLDRRFIGAYHFGAITLAWDARKPVEALRLLFNGMKANPLNWQLPFDAGFINYMLIGDYRAAAQLFRIAAKLPGAWSAVARWAPYVTAKSGDFATAREMWQELYYATENRKLRELIIRQLKWLKLEEGLATIQDACQRFLEKEGRFPRTVKELVEHGYLQKIPEEPFGGEYVIRDSKVYSTTSPGRWGE